MTVSRQPHETPVSIRVYRRTVRASLERIWENVLDWEHLPWLHRSTFVRIEPAATDEGGWRARVEFAPALGGETADVEVVLARDELFYTTRTLSGSGAGTEIVTTLAPRADATTDIEVDFRVAGVADADRSMLGDALQAVYAQLWDEDEAMMVERQSVLDERAGPASAPARRHLVLGRLARLRTALPLTIHVDGRALRLVEHGDEILVHSARCPHRGGPLGRCEVGADGVIECPWHGYRFDVRSGDSADGRGLRLAAAPTLRHDPQSDELALVW